MSTYISLDKIFFIDIETVPEYNSYNQLDATMRELWDKKAARFKDENVSSEECYMQNAAIYAEFGKIICISVGVFQHDIFRIKSFYGDNEPELLTEFTQLLHEHTKRPYFCGHNIKEFDIPYLCRRLLIHQIPLPTVLQIQGLKPWEVNHIDTMQMWKFGDYKNYTSLDLLTALLKIPSPKNDIDGSMVSHVYYNEKNLERIKDYCQNDVLAVANVYQKFQMKALIDPAQVVLVT